MLGSCRSDSNLGVVEEVGQDEECVRCLEVAKEFRSDRTDVRIFGAELIEVLVRPLVRCGRSPSRPCWLVVVAWRVRPSAAKLPVLVRYDRAPLQR